MSLECGHCERDIRGGHEPWCPRALPIFEEAAAAIYDDRSAILDYEEPGHRILELLAGRPPTIEQILARHSANVAEQPVSDWKELMEQGRRLASEREDLVAAGVDPAVLEVPLAPKREEGSDG